MKASGFVFLSKIAPQLTLDSRGVPQLMLPTVHRIAHRQTEAWRLIWVGQDANDFYKQHADRLTAGQPLKVTVKNLRTHIVGPFSEIIAFIESCELAPRVHEAAVDQREAA